MADRDDTARLRQLGEEIAAARDRLALLRAERDELAAKIKLKRVRSQDPPQDPAVTVVYGPDGDGLPLAVGPTRAVVVPGRR